MLNERLLTVDTRYSGANSFYKATVGKPKPKLGIKIKSANP